MSKARTLEIIVSEKNAELFHKNLATPLKDAPWSAGEHIEPCCFESEPDEDGYTFSIDMIAPLDADETPWVQLTIWNKDHEELYSGTAEIGVANRFCRVVDDDEFCMSATFAYQKNVVAFAEQLIRQEGFELYVDNGYFALRDLQEANLADIEEERFATLGVVIDRLDSYHEDYVYAPRWGEAMEFLENDRVADILLATTPDDIGDC